MQSAETLQKRQHDRMTAYRAAGRREKRGMPRYDAYVLRVWRSRGGDELGWSGRLEHMPDGQGRRFNSIEALLAHLRQVLAGDAELPRVDGRTEEDRMGDKDTQNTVETHRPPREID